MVLTVGLDEQLSVNEQLVKVFPNPFSSELKFSASELVTEISLYNSLGMLITTINSNSQELSMDTKDLAPGIYFIHYTTEKGIGIKKLIKQ